MGNVRNTNVQEGFSISPEAVNPNHVRDPYLNELSDPRLLREFSYLDGKWQDAKDGASISVFNPATGDLIAEVPDLTVHDARRAVNAAEDAILTWRAMLPQDRAKRLRAWFELIMENQQDLALIMTIEQGKPLSESLGEIEYAASFVEWFAEEAKRINGDVIKSHLPNREMTARREPIGVVAAVTPWNFPSAMITRKAAPALAAGCPVIVRPAEETPLSALALAELADRASIPAGVFSVLTGSRAVVEELCANSAVRAMSFTGSTKVGRLLMQQSSNTVKRLVLELGGHAPFILFPDVDLDAAVDGALAAKFQTSGQDCLAANRIYVHDEIYETFLARFAEKIKGFVVGNGLDPSTEIGPLMTTAAVDKCEHHVRDALDKGARLICGGKRHPRGDHYFEPTLLADVTPDMLISIEETFGPVAAVSRFNSEADINTLANHNEYGLMAYLYTNDHSRICRLTDVLEYGMVAVNCVKVTGYPIPFGGVKQSGLGREGGRWGMDDFLETKYVCAEYRAA
jgi:succinate-semialdehyde dehydrogenase